VVVDILGQFDENYSELLSYEQNILEQMYNNALEQQKAIRDKEEVCLLNLVAERDLLISEFKRVHRKVEELLCQNHWDMKEIETVMQSKLMEIYNIDRQNILDAERLSEELKESIQHIHAGKKAVTDGYYKNYTQVYGYFIDKKIGK
jgi:hypothetical protein